MNSEQQMKILHIISGYGGGISSHIRNLAKTVDSSKIIFDVAGFTGYSKDFTEEIHSMGGELFTLPRPKKNGYIQFIRKTVYIIKNNGPYDIVQCHISGYRALIFRIICSYCGITRMVVHAHRSSNDNTSGFINIIRERLDRMISRLTASQMTSCSTEASIFIFGEKAVKNHKVMHIPNSIPTEKYMMDLDKKQIESLKENSCIAKDVLVVGHIGRFNYQKNHMFMVEIIKQMVKLKIEFVWIFIGAGELEKTIIKSIENKNLQPYVRFFGRREDANILYQIMDVLAVPSFYEGLPTVVVEAQAAGIPSVISTNITREADMGMGMVKYISLDEDINYWIEVLIKATKISIPKIEARRKTLEMKGFTNHAAASLYEDFVFGKRKQFNFEELIN